MGNCCRKKKIEIIRRNPLITAEEVWGCDDGKQRLQYAMEYVPPGTVMRWDKLLAVVNRTVEPTEEEPDPTRVELELDEMKKAYRLKYHDIKASTSTGITLMRNYLPQMYDKHSFERGRRVSQREREDKNLIDESYAYGELDPEIFTTIYMKVVETYGKFELKNNVFYDLGCGVGNLVYCAAFIGNFKKCGGVEILDSLLQRGSKRISRWEKNIKFYVDHIKSVEFDFTQDDILDSDFWCEGTFVLLHWTAFNKEQIQKATNTFKKFREGTLLIAITHPISDPDWELLIKDSCPTSWGDAEYYIFEKLTPAAKRIIARRDDDDFEVPGNDDGNEGGGEGGDDLNF